MLALAEHRASRCDRCGGDLAETTAPDAEDGYQPALPVQCHRCVAFAQSEQAYLDHPHPLTLIHQVQPRRR